jgi:hypothetical protein
LLRLNGFRTYLIANENPPGSPAGILQLVLWNEAGICGLQWSRPIVAKAGAR